MLKGSSFFPVRYNFITVTFIFSNFLNEKQLIFKLNFCENKNENWQSKTSIDRVKLKKNTLMKVGMYILCKVFAISFLL